MWCNNCICRTRDQLFVASWTRIVYIIVFAFAYYDWSLNNDETKFWKKMIYQIRKPNRIQTSSDEMLFSGPSCDMLCLSLFNTWTIMSSSKKNQTPMILNPLYRTQRNVQQQSRFAPLQMALTHNHPHHIVCILLMLPGHYRKWVNWWRKLWPFAMLKFIKN